MYGIIAMNISKVSEQQKVKNNNIGSSVASIATASAVQAATAPLAIGIIKRMQKIGNLPTDKIELLHNTAEQALQNTGLSAKGVKIEYLKRAEMKNGLDALKMGPIAEIKAGFNAAFTRKPIKNFFGQVMHEGNRILMPEKGLSYAAFHEIGHAMNYHFSKIGKILQHTKKPGLLIASAISLFSAFSKQAQPKDGEELTKAQKTKNFIRNNAGKLSFAMMIPMLIEEAMATIKGNKLASKLLSPDMLKVVKKGNATVYLSYLTSAIGLGLASWAAVKVKDTLVAKKTKQPQ